MPSRWGGLAIIHKLKLQTPCAMYAKPVRRLGIIHKLRLQTPCAMYAKPVGRLGIIFTS